RLAPDRRRLGARPHDRAARGVDRRRRHRAAGPRDRPVRDDRCGRGRHSRRTGARARRRQPLAPDRLDLRLRARAFWHRSRGGWRASLHALRRERMTATTGVTSQQEALALFDSEYAQAIARLRGLSREDLGRPVFGEGAGWRIRDLIAHWAMWQRLAANAAEKIAAGTPW